MRRPMASEESLPMHVLGLRKTKGGRDDKEPAYKISRRRCRSYVWCVLIATVACGALGLLLYESAEARSALAPAWAAAVRARRAAQHVGHFRATRLGQELERHLERDMAEREWALLARSRLDRLEVTWRADVGAAGAGGADDSCGGAVADARAELLASSDALWGELRQTLSLLDALVSRGESAEQQHDVVQREILDELRRDGEERAKFADHASQADAAPRDAYAELDDAARKELLDADAWRRDLVDRFLANYDRELGDTARFALAPPDAALDKLDKLAAGLETTEAPLPWRAAEAALAELMPALEAAGAPKYEPNAPTADDALDYVQIHNVLAYLSDLKWRAKLNGARPKIDAARDAYDRRKLTPMAFVEQLEELEGSGAFPSDWLYSGLDDLEFAD